MELRNYQIQLITDTRNEFKTHKKILVQSPCGSGKTILFAWMCEQHLKKNKNGYVWFLVHREELIDQTIKTFKNNNICLDRVLIGMIQTVSKHLDKYEKPSMIIFDEAHHSSANTWLRIFETYPEVPIIGLTATPCRRDGKPLGSIYESLVKGPSVEWLINNKYLSSFEYYAPKINLLDSEWALKGSDYDMKSVEESFDKNKIYGDILKYINPLNKTIIYCPTIKYSQQLEKALNQHYKRQIAVHFDGNTPEKERKQIIEDFRSGKIRFLLNVDLIGEGFDVPDCDCCMLLRPTMSESLYIQQSMRCMRYQEGKSAIIYDFVGNCYKHGLPDEEREWSLDHRIKIKNTSEDKELLVRMCKSCYRIYKGNNRICLYCGFDNGKTKKQIEEDKRMELEKITKLKKKQHRIEVGKARTFDSLVNLGVKRGYKNPVAWANFILHSRKMKNS